MTPVAARALFGASFLAGAGCSTVLGVEADRYVEPAKSAAGDGGRDALAADAADGGRDVAPTDRRDGDAPIGPWACLTAPREALDPDLHVDVTLQVMDAILPSTAAGAVDGGSDLDTLSGSWLPGVAVRPCALLDPECLDAPKAVLTSDAGAAELALTGDFAGFFDMRRPDLVPATLYPGHLLAGQMAASVPAYGISPKEFRDLASSTATTVNLDPNGGVGHVLVTIYDCQDHQASGVSLTYGGLGAQAVPFYFTGGLPSTRETKTDDYGIGGAINVPVGTLTVTATLASTTTEVGSTTFDVRPGALTFAWIRVRSR
jgi:hypothetical protein